MFHFSVIYIFDNFVSTGDMSSSKVSSNNSSKFTKTKKVSNYLKQIISI